MLWKSSWLLFTWLGNVVTGKGFPIIGLHMLWQEKKAGRETNDVEISSYALACAPPTPSTACSPYFHCTVQTEEESTYTYNVDGGIFPWAYVFLRKRWCLKTKPGPKMSFSESQIKWRSAFHNAGLADFIASTKGLASGTHISTSSKDSVLSTPEGAEVASTYPVVSMSNKCVAQGAELWAGHGAREVGGQPEEKPDPSVQSNTGRSP